MDDSPPRDDELLQLVHHVYEGSVDPFAWQSIVGRMTAYMGAAKGRLFTALLPPEKGGLGISVGVPEAALRVWADKYIKHDIWVHAGMQKGLVREGNVVTDRDLVPEHEFLQSVIYREHLKALGVARLCVGVIFDPASFGVHMTVFAVYRDVTEPPFGDADVERMRALVPHLSRSLGVMFRLRDAELRTAASLAALDRLTSGVLLIGSELDVVFANAAARKLLAQGAGIRLEGSNGSSRLRARDPQLSQALARALAEATREGVAAPHFSRSLQVPSANGSGALVMQFAPLPESHTFDAPAEVRAIAFVADPNAPPELDETTLRNVYGATQAEARLARQLVAGKTLAEAAEEQGIAVATVRTQLASLFQKTGTSRQGDLIKLLASLASGAQSPGAATPE